VLRRRVLSGLIYGVVSLAAVWVGGAAFMGVVLAMALLGGREYQNMVARSGYGQLRLMQYGLTAYLIVAWAWLPAEVAQSGLLLIFVSSLAWQLVRTSAGKQPYLDWAITLAGGLYLGWLAAHFIPLRALPDGLQWMLLALAATWACDSLAYLCGRAWGRHSFFTDVSPHKTLEGALAGWLGGTLVVVLLGSALGLSVVWTLGLGLVCSLAAICGDLVESLIKRQMGVKDSGGLVPGHGGVLDRVDSLLLVVVFMYYYVRLIPGA
jgi:phosphatidate cytidylyltransferase